MDKIYRAVEGARFNDKDAEIIGKRLEYLSKKYNGATPAVIFQDAKSKRSPIHRFFEWEPEKILHEYGLNQARYLARNIKIKIIQPEPIEIRGFISVVVKDRKCYVPMEKVLSDKELTKQLIAQAKNQLETWSENVRKYNKLKSYFRNILSAVDSLEV